MDLKQLRLQVNFAGDCSATHCFIHHLTGCRAYSVLPCWGGKVRRTVRTRSAGMRVPTSARADASRSLHSLVITLTNQSVQLTLAYF